MIVIAIDGHQASTGVLVFPHTVALKEKVHTINLICVYCFVPFMFVILLLKGQHSLGRSVRTAIETLQVTITLPAQNYLIRLI